MRAKLIIALAVAGLCLAHLCAFAAPLAKEVAQATDRAFDALLSWGNDPRKGYEWTVQPPDGFEAASEADLIEWLKSQRKKGANFNALRHEGTLLHHAIRLGLDDTALWLIQNGADPAAKLGQNDTLSLALADGRWEVFDALLRLPAYSNLTRSRQEELYLQAATASKDPILARAILGGDGVNHLFSLGIPLPEGRKADSTSPRLQ